MKSLKFIVFILFIAFLTYNNSWGQKVIQKETIVTLYEPGIDYGVDIGTVTGTYKYTFTLHLNKEGYLDCVSWHATDWNLHNQDGDWVKVIDSGHDTYACLWDIWNNIGFYNTGWNISYDVKDGWLNEWMPSEMPSEGSFVSMSTKILCKGKILDMSFMIQFHINANGDITANVVKP